MLIAIAGKDGVGKSYLAGKLATLFGDAVVLAFATKLRHLCVEQGFLIKQEAFSKPTSTKARKVLRERSEYFKAFYGNSDYFVDECSNTWSLLATFNTPIIIHDLRYLCEAEEVIESGGTLIYLGDFDLTPEERKEPSFQDLPLIYELKDYHLPAKPSEEKIFKLFNTLLSHDS
ncbi:hypothetical protein Lepto7375DRAFT_7181 [Leptolyngbya sp. PCC 7375]|nr:hypothetical protein Lepto7375DRAFT_7181 [Leptolyngbya sp. PCC 7375]